MVKMITYKKIENLPDDHPLVKEFMKQCALEDEMYSQGAVFDLEDEEGLDYFNRYIAGDR